MTTNTRPLTRTIKLEFIVLVLAVSALRAPAGDVVFVSLAGENRIAVYDLNDETGELRHRADVSVDGDPGALCTDPTGRYLFASLRKKGHLASFQIDSATRSLRPIHSVSADADPAYLATDHAGKYLLSAYYAAGKVAVHEIAEDGRISETGRWYDTDEKAHAILPDRTNRWILVPHTGPNAIFQFRFDATQGVLTPNNPVKVTTPPQTGPRHIDFHPTANFVYCDNEQGSSVTAFRFDPRRGTLAPFQTESTLPTDFTASNSCAHMEISPSGRHLYAANRGHDSIAAFAVDGDTGKIRRVGIFNTERTPRSFDIDMAGRFLVAAGQDSDNLAVYRINADSGALTRIGTYSVGTRPWWVQIVTLD